MILLIVGLSDKACKNSAVLCFALLGPGEIRERKKIELEEVERRAHSLL